MCNLNVQIKNVDIEKVFVTFDDENGVNEIVLLS